MEETAYGTRDKRGNWRPNERAQPVPIFTWPPQLKKSLLWLFGYPGYLWPWNAIFLLLSMGIWMYLTPPLETMREFRIGWISLILLRNTALVILLYGCAHYLLYIRRQQQTAFKYSDRWPDSADSRFVLGSQTAENVFWTLASGVPIWTAWEALTWWMFANGYIAWVDFAQHPVYFVALLLVVPVWRAGVHFYFIHRLLHIGPLYNFVHKLHHKNVNPGPWSGLSMHPIEHLLYFSGVLLHFIVPSHPLHAMLQLVETAISPLFGHTGFHHVAYGKDKYINLGSGSYFHYLHHKFFKVNYGTRMIPLDHWFGTEHDGTPEAEEEMYKRMRAQAGTRRNA